MIRKMRICANFFERKNKTFLLKFFLDPDHVIKTPLTYTSCVANPETVQTQTSQYFLIEATRRSALLKCLDSSLALSAGELWPNMCEQKFWFCVIAVCGG